MSNDDTAQQIDGSLVRNGPIVYKNVRAYWEQEMRQGLYLPAFSSKFMCEKAITQMKHRDILAIR